MTSGNVSPAFSVSGIVYLRWHSSPTVLVAAPMLLAQWSDSGSVVPMRFVSGFGSLRRWLRRRRGSSFPLEHALATEDDIVAAYRLLFGRNPDAEGFEHHRELIGSISIGDLVARFSEAEEFRDGPLMRQLLPTWEQDSTRVTSVRGFDILVPDFDGAVGAAIAASSDYEPHLSSRFERCVEPGATVVDIGCNIGWFSMLSCALVGETGAVHSFDVSPANVASTARSAAANGFANIELYPFALGSESKLLRYEVSRGTNGIVRPYHPSETDDGNVLRQLVRSVRIDDVLGELGRVDVVKLDVEGAEYDVVMGATDLLTRHRPIIFTEYSPELIDAVSGASGPAYLQWFVDNGWTINIIDQRGDTSPSSPDAATREVQAKGLDHIDLELLPASSGGSG